MTDSPTCVVHIDETGNSTYLICGEADMLIVDERAPHDRVYRVSGTLSPSELEELVNDSPIGSAQDMRHAALAVRIMGKPHIVAISDVSIPAATDGSSQPSIGEMKRRAFDAHLRCSHSVLIIEERGADCIVHQWTDESILPPTAYVTKRKAAARLLQLLDIGPVAPQTWGERIGIDTITIDPENDI